MTQKDADLEQLRLIDDFLEEEIINLSDSDVFKAEIRQATTAVEESGLRDIESFLNRRRGDAWVLSARNARLIFPKLEVI